VLCLSRKEGATPETIVCSSGRAGTGGRKTISKPSPGLGDSITRRFANGPLGSLAPAYAASFGAERDEVAPACPPLSYCIPKGQETQAKSIDADQGLMGINRQTDARRAPDTVTPTLSAMISVLP
jgi:hypothetical protein